EGAEALELTPTAEVQAIRIVQEALNNVRKHSGAWEAWVKVRSRNGWLTITVEDTGRGFDPQQVNRTRDQVGLQSMRERAVVAGGQLSIESAPGKGTMVTLTLPVGKGE
ncbi:MAG: sensor histidine kinase, partial [Candidatus Methylomirabilia bacterium]